MISSISCQKCSDYAIKFIVFSSAILIALSTISLIGIHAPFPQMVLFNHTHSMAIVIVSTVSLAVSLVYLCCCERTQEARVDFSPFENLAEKEKVTFEKYYEHNALHFELMKVTDLLRERGTEDQKKRWDDLLAQLHHKPINKGRCRLDTSFARANLKEKVHLEIQVEILDHKKTQDIEDLKGIHFECLNSNVRIIEKEGILWLIVRNVASKEIIGGVMFNIDSQGAEIFSLCKRPHLTKTGMTKAIVQFLKDNRKKIFGNLKNIKFVCDVHEKNTFSKRLYEQLGFKKEFEDPEIVPMQLQVD